MIGRLERCWGARVKQTYNIPMSPCRIYTSLQSPPLLLHPIRHALDRFLEMPE